MIERLSVDLYINIDVKVSIGFALTRSGLEAKISGSGSEGYRA